MVSDENKEVNEKWISPFWSSVNTTDLSLWFLTVAGLVGKLNPKNKVDLTNPELTIIVEVIKAVCCISVVKDYTLYRKYNVQEVMKEDTPKPDVTTAKTDTNAAEQKEKHDAEETNKEEEKKGDEDNDNNGPQDNKEADKEEVDGE